MLKNKWADLKPGLKTLASRNAIITILYNIAYSYSISMKNAARPLVVKLSCGLPVSYVGVLGSVFSCVALVLTMPVGALIDKQREWMKRTLIIVNIIRAFIYVFGYGMVTSKFGVTAVYVIDGLFFCFTNIMGPALMAVSVNKKAMGSAFALYSGVSAICISTSKSLGVSLFNNVGRFQSFLVAGGIALLSAVILMFLDKEQVSDTMRAEAKEMDSHSDPEGPTLPTPQEQKAKKRRIAALFAGISIAAIPLATSIGLAQIEDMVSNSYLAILALDKGFDYYTAQSVLAAISGIITIFIGVICDLINPTILVYAGLIGKTAGSFLIFTANSQPVFLMGFILITITDFFITVVRICAVKMFPYHEQGSLAATISFMMSVCMMLGTLPAGFMAEAHGTNYAYLYNSMTSLLGIAFYTFSFFYLRKRNQRLANQV